MNFILSIPYELRLAALAVVGACLGAVVNFLTVRWEFSPRSLSPWFFLRWSKGIWPRAGDAKARSLAACYAAMWAAGIADRWLAGDSPGFAARAEAGLGSAAGDRGALRDWPGGALRLGSRPRRVAFASGSDFANFYCASRAEDLRSTTIVLHAVFLSHACLSVLILVASLIDLDEGLIPDEITVPGTLLGLLIAAVLPTALLPVVEIIQNPNGPLLVMRRLEFLTLSSPRGWPWPKEVLGTPDFASLPWASVQHHGLVFQPGTGCPDLCARGMAFGEH